MIAVSIFSIVSLYLIVRARSDFLVFTFFSLFFFLFVVIPFFILAIDYETSDLAIISLQNSIIFIIGFFVVYQFLNFGKIANTTIYYFEYSGFFKYIANKSVYIVLVGILMKIAGGDLVHSSIFDIPWKFPVLFGISDRVYYLGIMLTCAGIYNYGISKGNLITIAIVLSLGIFGGSRVSILIPVAFLLLLTASQSSVSRLLLLGCYSVIFIFAVIVFVGLYRIDSQDRAFDFNSLLDVFLFRISEFVWPAKLIELLESSAVNHNSYWIFSALFGIFPGSFSDALFGESVFARDTNLMFDVGLGNEYMSVPLTPLGEGYYWLGHTGVLLISVFFALGFFIILKITRRIEPAKRMLLYLQLFRSTFALPVAAFPEFISFLTKDIIIDFLVVFVFFKLFIFIRFIVPPDKTNS